MKMRFCFTSSGICRKKNVSSSVRMWEPSMSASVMMTIFPYRSLAMSNSSPMPVESAWMIVRISSKPRILSRRAFSTLRILPLSGRIACVSWFRPPLALPPAESPSTR